MRLSNLVAILTIAVSLCSCVHRKFDYEGQTAAYVEVVFDWKNDPGADPKSMILYMYPHDGGHPERFDFSGRDGGRIRIAPGLYDAVCINSDVRNVIYNGETSGNTLEITTSETSYLTFQPSLSVNAADLPMAPGTETQKWFVSPPVMWSGVENSVNVTVDARSGRKADVEYQVITLYPKRIVDTYVVTVKNIRNIGYLYSLSATISDMAPGYFAGLAIRSEIPAIIPLELSPDKDAANAEGRFLTFGHCPDKRREHKLMLHALLTDNKSYHCEFDVSDQAHNPPDEQGIYHIVVELLDLPDPSQGGNMAPSVGDWKEDDIYIPLAASSDGKRTIRLRKPNNKYTH